PADPGVGQPPRPLVLAAQETPRLQLRAERERGAAVAAETLGQPGLPVPGAADRTLAPGAESPALRHLRVREDGAGGVMGGDRRGLPQAPPPGPPGPPAGTAPPAPGGPPAPPFPPSPPAPHRAPARPADRP